MTPRIKDIYTNYVVNTPALKNNCPVSDMELLFILEGNERARSLYQEYKLDMFNLNMKHAQKLKELLRNIKTQDNICFHSNQSQNT